MYPNLHFSCNVVTCGGSSLAIHKELSHQISENKAVYMGLSYSSNKYVLVPLRGTDCKWNKRMKIKCYRDHSSWYLKVAVCDLALLNIVIAIAYKIGIWWQEK